MALGLVLCGRADAGELSRRGKALTRILETERIRGVVHLADPGGLDAPGGAWSLLTEEWQGVLPPDAAFDPDHLPVVLARLARADLVVVERMHRGRSAAGRLRDLGDRLAARALVGLDRDPHAALFARRTLVTRADLRTSTRVADLELIAKAGRLGATVVRLTLPAVRGEPPAPEARDRLAERVELSRLREELATWQPASPAPRLTPVLWLAAGDASEREAIRR